MASVLLQTQIYNITCHRRFLILSLTHYHHKIKARLIMSHQIKELNEKERTWLSLSLATGRKIMQQLTNTPKPEVTTQALDQTFLLWAKNTSSFTHEEIASGLGCLFGELLRQSFPFSWKIVDDTYGSEAALIDEATGSIVFPVNTVWKRIEPELQAEPIFAPMWQAITDHLKQ